MSSSNSPTLVLELGRRWLRFLPAMLLLIASLGLPWLAETWSLVTRLLCVSVGLAAAVWSLWQTGVFQPARQLTKLSWDHDQQWQLQFGMDKPIMAELLGRSWYSPWVLCLKLKAESGRRYQVLVWRSELSRQTWHQWLLRLRQEGGRGPQNLAAEFVSR
jgi:hypothetical protein